MFHHGGRPFPTSEIRTAVKSKRVTMKLLGPLASNASMTLLRIPVMTAARATTTDTPTATPRIVRAERITLVRMASKAIFRPSLRAANLDAPSCGLRLFIPECIHRIELRSLSSRIYSSNDAHTQTETDSKCYPLGADRSGHR